MASQSTYLVKDVNVDLLKRMRAAELVDLVVNLIVYPCVIIVDTVVEQSVIDIILTQTINNLKSFFILVNNTCY